MESMTFWESLVSQSWVSTVQVMTLRPVAYFTVLFTAP